MDRKTGNTRRGNGMVLNLSGSMVRNAEVSIKREPAEMYKEDQRPLKRR